MKTDGCFIYSQGVGIRVDIVLHFEVLPSLSDHTILRTTLYTLLLLLLSQS